MNPNQLRRVGVVSYVVRKSMFFPIVNILVLQIIILLIMLSIKPIVDTLNTVFKLHWSLEDIRTWWIVLFQMVNTAAIFYFIFGWLFTLYIIRPQEVIYRKGLLLEERLDYRFDEIFTVDVVQTRLGKMFDFGTIKVYTDGIKEQAVLYDIPQPHKFAEAISKRVGTSVNIKPNNTKVSPAV